jgi:hypothetical protein
MPGRPGIGAVADTQTYPFGINAQGDIVGYYRDDVGRKAHGFLLSGS